MSSSLRVIIKRHQQEKALKNYLGPKYAKTSREDKEKFLEAVDTTVEREVDQLLNTLIDDVRNGSTERKSRIARAYLNIGATIICTPGIAYTVNQNNWALVTMFSLILLGINAYNIHQEY